MSLLWSRETETATMTRHLSPELKSASRVKKTPKKKPDLPEVAEVFACPTEKLPAPGSRTVIIVLPCLCECVCVCLSKKSLARFVCLYCGQCPVNHVEV